MKAGLSYPRKQDVENTPALYATEETPTAEKVVTMKLFSPYNNWEWYIVELDPERNLAFGYTKGQFGEWGYIDLNELKRLRVFGGRLPAVEQDVHFTPAPFGELEVA